MDKRYQVFVSSTFADLEIERGKVMQTILNFDCFPAGMELFPAMDEEQFEYIKRIIDDSDYYLLIIGGRYGSVDDKGVSWTEKEYDYAVSKEIPVLVFDYKDFTKLPADKTDQDDKKRKKLIAFKKKVSTGRLIKYWTNVNDLDAVVAKSLPRVLELQPRTGWARADKFFKESKRTDKELKELRDYREKNQILLRKAQEKIKSLEKELKNLKATNRAKTARSPFETITIPGTNVSFKMVFVEGGTFMMGAKNANDEAESDEKPTHQVSLSDYYIGETQVTQALWKAVMGENPSEFKRNPNRPVENVSWNDCQRFIEKLNGLTGKSFHLPTEAQWEFAARGGNLGKNKGFKYAGSDILNEVAWYEGNSKGKSHPVAQKDANELGLYDMSGNVWEWCQDWFGDYTDEPQTDPKGPENGSFRVYRGGSWRNIYFTGRVLIRRQFFPDYKDNDVGLRLAL